MGEEEFVCESRTDSLNLSVRRNPDWRVSVVFVKKKNNNNNKENTVNKKLVPSAVSLKFRLKIKIGDRGGVGWSACCLKAYASKSVNHDSEK